MLVYCLGKKLYTYGYEKYDNLIFTVPREDIALFLDKINCINEKYGIPKRWRTKESEKYFSISSTGIIELKIEVNDVFDKLRYDLGNYFKTREEAKKVINSNDWQELWDKVRAGEIGGEND